jgi:hypothetical protein
MKIAVAMRNLLKLEEVGLFLLSIYLFSLMEYAWWVYPACILIPDLSMLGYVFNPKVGAQLYNLFHHKFLAVAVLLVGFYFSLPLVSLAGVILLGHSAMDRIFGYGLKYNDSFKHTHLGWIGS